MKKVLSVLLVCFIVGFAFSLNVYAEEKNIDNIMELFQQRLNNLDNSYNVKHYPIKACSLDSCENVGVIQILTVIPQDGTDDEETLKMSLNYNDTKKSISYLSNDSINTSLEINEQTKKTIFNELVAAIGNFYGYNDSDIDSIDMEKLDLSFDNDGIEFETKDLDEITLHYPEYFKISYDEIICNFFDKYIVKEPVASTKIISTTNTETIKNPLTSIGSFTIIIISMVILLTIIFVLNKKLSLIKKKGL